jgi:hypothetical protein
MPTLTRKRVEQVRATDVHFIDNMLSVSLSDGRELSIPMQQVEWLQWLLKATPEQRAKWSFEPGGFAIYWEELDDGIELCHLLDMKPLVLSRKNGKMSRSTDQRKSVLELT